jgi:hypothetical protein
MVADLAAVGFTPHQFLWVVVMEVDSVEDLLAVEVLGVDLAEVVASTVVAREEVGKLIFYSINVIRLIYIHRI